MAKKAGDIGARLHMAALHLFQERGYDRTTAVEIAARAGVTERTFFRYFPDKREVLFNGQATVLALLTAAVSEARPDLQPLATLFTAFQTLLPGLEANRPWLVERHGIISSTPALREREVMKQAELGDSLAVALERRGVPQMTAVLAARTGVAALSYAVSTWLENPKVDIGPQLEMIRLDLKALVSFL